ncbi:hypothetical protein CUS_5065 [Ruminococcus albus 8]|uniref:Uncharacterized protein n=1 Tax=Ruminococcus albus 8 TaxID=246199 RepID=E9SDB2_RUMAL|nr:hypothetical protein CUS_5065 [Ruminococcus albus 8]
MQTKKDIGEKLTDKSANYICRLGVKANIPNYDRRFFSDKYNILA